MATAMLIEVSQIIVLGLGVLVFGLATWGFAQPARLMQLVTSSVDQPWGIYVAVITRLALGAALVGIAPASRFPITFQLLGVVTLAAAVALAIVGRARLRRFLNWWVNRFSTLAIRLWLVLGMAFGLFLVFGVL